MTAPPVAGAELAALAGRTVDSRTASQGRSRVPGGIRGADRLDLRDRRELYNGFGDTLARAVELVALPLIFAFLGHLVDRGVGTAPVFTVALGVFALAGTFVRTYYAYETAMRAQERAAPWARSAPLRQGRS